MSASLGEPKWKCRFGGAHETRSARLVIATARLTDSVAEAELVDDEARYWQGFPVDEFEQHRAIGRTTGANPLMADASGMSFVGRDLRTSRLVIAITLDRRHDGGYDVGGTVGPDFRRQGYGREALLAVCLLAHQHLGIVNLTAGCETTNQASQRWLTSCGFRPSDGPPTHLLPNGRVIAACWWRREASGAKRRCRNLPPANHLLPM
jgi:RimJ/RimL family protein N-acetyltransferase